MTGSQIIRFLCILALWLLLCYFMIVASPQVTFYTIFVIVVSGIVIWVPLYKKYIKKNNGGEKDK